MYQRNHNSELDRLSTLQHVSLEKHRHIVDRSLRWQEQTEPRIDSEEAGSTNGLRPVFATILNIFAR